MIVVTVGSTHFDQLINVVDDFNEKAGLEIVCQIGQGKYLPKHCRFKRYFDNFNEILEAADLIVTHGGATVFECVDLKKKFIAVPNKNLADNHQEHLLTVLENVYNFPVCKSFSDLGNLIMSSLSTPQETTLGENKFYDYLESIL